MDRDYNGTGVYRLVDGDLREIAVELADAEIIAALRALSPEERLRKAAAHSRYVRRLLRTQLESLHPEWSEDRLKLEIRRRLLGE
jgi:hypothetical protein